MPTDNSLATALMQTGMPAAQAVAIAASVVHTDVADGDSLNNLTGAAATAMRQAAAAIADDLIVINNPPTWSADFTDLTAIPANVTCTAPSLSSRGLYVSAANQVAAVDLNAVLPSFDVGTWTVEVEFELDDIDLGTGTRTPAEISSSGSNRCELDIGAQQVDTLGVRFVNVSGGSAVTAFNLGATLSGRGKTNRYTFGVAAGVGFYAINGHIVDSNRSWTAQTGTAAATKLYLGGRNPGGLNNGFLFGWIKRVRVWNSKIPLNRATVWQPQSSLPIFCSGDSLTEGSGATNTQFSYPHRLGRLMGRQIHNGGVASETSTQIRNRVNTLYESRPYMRAWPTVIWAGHNNLTSPDTVMADIAAMISKLRTDQFLVLGCVNGTGSGTGYDAIQVLNARMASAYPENYVNIREQIIARSGGTNDTPAASIQSTPPHFNDAGYLLAAQIVKEALDKRGW